MRMAGLRRMTFGVSAAPHPVGARVPFSRDAGEGGLRVSEGRMRGSANAESLGAYSPYPRAIAAAATGMARKNAASAHR